MCDVGEPFIGDPVPRIDQCDIALPAETLNVVVHGGPASPGITGAEAIRHHQVHLLEDRKLAKGTVVIHISALRFLYVRVLKRREMKEDLPYPKCRKRLPVVLSREEVGHLIDSAKNLFYRAMLMTLLVALGSLVYALLTGAAMPVSGLGIGLFFLGSVQLVPGTEAFNGNQLPLG